MSDLEQTPVLIAGAGPVGTTLAMDLARLGVPSVLLERRRAIPPNPRCRATRPAHRLVHRGGYRLLVVSPLVTGVGRLHDHPGRVPDIGATKIADCRQSGIVPEP